MSEDCAAGNNVCDSAGTCAASAVDPVGTAEDVTAISSGVISGNAIEVHSNRLVTEIEANLLLDQPRDLRWVIWVWNGTEFEALATQLTTNQQGSAYFSSGAMSTTLEAGKRYVLGVGLVAGEGYLYHDLAPWDAEPSFGAALGRVQTFYPGPGGDYVQDLLYAIRVTTELP